jgi:ubiquinone/menaquinone biosynthesis C-methylase UbiE
MTERAERLRRRFFASQEHPYRLFEREVERHLRPQHTLLDAGCGRTAPILTKYHGKARRLVGVDVVDFGAGIEGVELVNSDLANMPLEDGCADLVMARSVMEHLTDPLSVYRELNRVMRPGGHLVVLTANLWDYASLIAKLVPNRFHPWIVARTEGRAEEDVFPVAYRTNTYGAVKTWAGQAGFEIVSFEYLGQYPGYFMFNAFLFLLATAYEKIISSVEGLRFLRGWILVVLRKR